MTSNLKKNIIRGLLSSLLILVVLFAFLLISYNVKIASLQKQIDVLKYLNNTQNMTFEQYVNDKEYIIENYYIVSFVDQEENTTDYLLNKNLSFAVYDFLLTLKDFKAEDFTSFDGKNYYFKDGMTNILGLDSSFYDQEYGYLIVGLQAIEITGNMTIYNDPIEKWN